MAGILKQYRCASGRRQNVPHRTEQHPCADYRELRRQNGITASSTRIRDNSPFSSIWPLVWRQVEWKPVEAEVHGGVQLTCMESDSREHVAQ